MSARLKLPADWKNTRLGEVGSFLKGKGILKTELSETGLPAIRYGEIYTTHHFIVKSFQSFITRAVAAASEKVFKNDILFAGSGETLEEIGKAVAYTRDEEAYAGGDVIIMRASPKLADAEFLGYSLNIGTANKQKRMMGQGHSVVHIYPSDLSELSIPLPPLPEQKAIARILSTWDRAIEKTEQLITQKQKLKKGLMQQLLTGKVRFKEFVENPWRLALLSDCIYGNGTYGVNAAAVPYSPTLPTYLRITDISDLGKYMPKEKVSVQHTDSDKYFLTEGDIVFARTGATTGKTYLYDKSDGRLVYAGFLIKFSPDKKRLLPSFLKYFTETSSYWNWVKTVSTRSGQPGINSQEYGELKVPNPNIIEQKKIIRVLDVIDNEIHWLIRQADLLGHQKSGLMQQLLTGIVRVKA